MNRGELLVRHGLGRSSDEGFAGARDWQQAAEPGPGARIRTMFRIFGRRRKLIVFMLIALNALAFVAIRHIPPQFTAEANLIIGPRQEQVLDLKAVLAGLGGDSEAVESELQLLRSRRVVRAVVQQLQLDQNPEFNPPPASPGVIPMLQERWSLLWDRFAPATLRQLVQTEERSVPALPPTPTDPITVTTDAVLRHLSVAPRGHSRVVTVSFECGDPALAASVANEVINTYIASQLNAKREATANAHRWLEDRVAEMRDQVIKADHAVADYRRRAAITQGRTGNLLAEQISTLGEQVIQAQASRANAEARLQALKGKRGIETMPEAVGSPTIQQLRVQQATLLAQAADLSRNLGEQHPRVMATRAAAAAVGGRIQAELSNLSGSLQEEVRAAQAREADLTAALASLRRNVDSGTESEVELHALEHEADANRALYDRLLARSRETNVEGGLQQPDAQVVSLADAPRRPTFPNPLVLMPIFFITSCIATLLVVFGMESMDTGFSTLEEVEQKLGVSALGVIPRLRRRLFRRDATAGQPMRIRAAFAEAVRNLYTGLMLSGSEHPPKVILVTSALPGEGKSSVVLSLARLMASVGKRVVVVDCDLRRPVMHEAFGIARGPGLTDCLSGRASISEVLQGDSRSPAALLPAGTPGRNSPDLFASDDFRKTLTQLSKLFDLVLIDSSPLLAVSETRHLSRLADTTVLVVRWRATRQFAAAAAVRRLREAGGSLAGVLLSVVDLKQFGHYSGLNLYQRRISLYLSE